MHGVSGEECWGVGGFVGRGVGGGVVKCAGVWG